jgi:hypothetical protein
MVGGRANGEFRSQPVSREVQSECPVFEHR